LSTEKSRECKHLPKGVILEDGGPPDDRRRRFAAVRRSRKADVRSLDAMVNDVVLMIKKLLFLILRSFGHEKFSISRDLVAPLEERAYSM
jgi:hypothetical protein